MGNSNSGQNHIDTYWSFIDPYWLCSRPDCWPGSPLPCCLPRRWPLFWLGRHGILMNQDTRVWSHTHVSVSWDSWPNHVEIHCSIKMRWVVESWLWGYRGYIMIHIRFSRLRFKNCEERQSSSKRSTRLKCAQDVQWHMYNPGCEHVKVWFAMVVCAQNYVVWVCFPQQCLRVEGTQSGVRIYIFQIPIMVLKRCSLTEFPWGFF